MYKNVIVGTLYLFFYYTVQFKSFGKGRGILLPTENL